MSVSDSLIFSNKVGKAEKSSLAKGIEQQVWTKYAFLFLILASFSVDFFTPYLVRMRILPNSVRFLADAAILGLFVLLLFRSIVFDKIPLPLFLIFAILAVWGLVATYEGQPLLATLWGAWRLFKYPIIGILTYLQPFWPDNFHETLRIGCLRLLQVNISLQIFQYASGDIPGDHLSGFFGKHGVSPLLFLIIFCLAVALGRWLAESKWDMLLWVLPLGAVASGLGEMKLFPFVVVALSSVTFVVQLLRGRQYQKLFFYVVFVAIVTVSFGMFYNTVVAEARGTLRIEEYLNVETLDEYLNRSYRRDNGNYYLGRGFALQLGWDTIQRDGTTFLFGMGVGTRSESTTLGVAGAGLVESVYGLNSGTSLLVMMQEFGVVGLVLFEIIMLWSVFVLWLSVEKNSKSPYNTLRFAIMLLSLLWPIWLWYSQTWTFGVFMTLYWGTLGYLLGFAKNNEPVPEPVSESSA
ncbi:MAG: hypothetical protein AAF490_00725 [Chloroflexota bacterium]